MKRPARSVCPSGVWLGLALLFASCPGPDPGTADAATLDGGSGDAGDTVPARQYCEQTVEAFCPFYLRCGRIAEADLDSCRSTFLESCNAVYEPRYAALAEAQLLELSRAGIAACAEHLAQVPCEHQLFDLEGPCRSLWRGLVSPGGACGAGVESFVCDATSTCVVSLSLCGSCEPAAATGEACDTSTRCRYPDLCVEGRCVGAVLPGEDCGTEQRCISGASCVSGICEARSFVAVGEDCDASHRCPYRSTCSGGVCVRDALQGESCADRSCATGTCEPSSNTCVAQGDRGAACSEAVQCLSGVCADGLCSAPMTDCVTQ